MVKSINQYTAVFKKDGKWIAGWIEEIPGVNTQGKTLKEAKKNLKDALKLVLETNKMLAQKEYGTDNITRELVFVPM